MAQIIKHRRGNLEGLKDATTRAGELLVVTGSSGLGTIANGADLVFVGIDGSTASPVNKILQGTTVPDLTGGNYNTHVDGIPFFDTDDQKLYILNKGGNVEVKATPQTGGTGIVSGSAQLANSTVSNESLNAATGSYLTGTIDISSGTNLAVSDTTEVNMILTGDTISAELIGGVVSGSAQISGVTNTQLAGSIANAKLANSAITISGTSVSLGGAITDETLFGGTGVVTGSAQITNIANSQLAGSIANGKLANSAITISGTSVSLGGAITDETLFGGTGVVSGSAQLANSTVSNESLNSATGSYLTTVDISSNTNLAVSDTSEVNMILTGDTISAELIGGVVSGSAQITGVTNTQLAGSIANGKLANSAVTISGTSVSLGGAITDEVLFGGVGVVTGSAQIVAGLSNQATDFGTGRISGDSIGDLAGTSTITGSFVGNGAGLTGVASTLTIGADSGDDDTVNLSSGTLNFVGTSNEIETTVSNDQIQIGIPTNPTLSGNVTVTGNLTVEGTTTTIDSTTVNIGDRILELNYARGAGDAGLLVSDVDGATTVSGSLLWDASSDHWMAGGLGSEKEIARLNASPTSNTVLKANASGLLVDSLITDDGTNVTISGTAELRINGATANSFVYFDANKSIEAVAASNAGDVIQWNGSSFVASNSIDGGTF